MMRKCELHSWEVSTQEAIAIQRELAPQVVRSDTLPAIRRVAGVDIGFENNGTITRAAVVVLEAESLAVLEQAIARRPTSFPYVPGLLSFREIPAALEALAELQQAPDLVLCDGQGFAHPRRFGLACHLGLVTDIPCIGVGKTRLIGEHAPVPPERGAWSPLMHDGEIIGAALRSRAGTKPIYVSIGHRVTLETAIHQVMACTPRYRLPETTRRAHRLASHKP